MQRLGGPWLPHVLPLRTPPSNTRVRYKHHRRRRIWPNNKHGLLRKSSRIFEASPLILDLDAEENKYVRPYNEEVDGAPEPNWLQRVRDLLPVRKRVAEFERIYQEYEAHFRATRADKFHPWRISDYDILSAALDDLSTIQPQPLPTSTDPPHNTATTDVLEWNGIPHWARDSPSKTIAYMLRRQQLSQRLQPATDDEEPLKHALRECAEFTEVERLITNIIQTPQGCQLVSSCSATLGQVCQDIAQKTVPQQMLPFLNNVMINLSSRGLPISAPALWCAYEASLQCRAFSVAQKYMKIIVGTNNQFQDAKVLHTLKILQKSISLLKSGDAVFHIKEDTASQFLAIYSLLTGWTLGGQAPQPSLRDFIVYSSGQIFELYIACLAQLGAFRTMWYIWHTDSRDFRDGPVEESSSLGLAIGTGVGLGDERELKAQAFGHAIREATRTGSNLADLAQAPDFTHTAGKYDEDCQLDIEAIIKSADILPVSEGSIKRPRDDSHIHPAGSDEGIRKIFERRSIREAMLALQHCLARLRSPSASHVGLGGGIAPPRRNQ
ncbi:hypothetical protein AAE478_003025 [Parahypoxylon ruwenzoriense]